MTSAEIDALFAQTLLGDFDGDEPWEAVRKLRRNGSREIFERAAAWCESDDQLKRSRAADILCQSYRRRNPDEPGDTEWLFRDETCSLLTKMLENEQDKSVIESAVVALGHLYNPKTIPSVLRFQDHADENIRFAVASSLASFANEAQALAALLKLARDSDAEVRDWAVFGLGVLGDADTPEIREALLQCLVDTNEDVAEEAAVRIGQAQRPACHPKAARHAG